MSDTEPRYTAAEWAARAGRTKTPKKAAASRANIERANASKPPPAACTCGRQDGSHASACPAYRRAAIAKYRAKQAAKEAL